MTKRIQLFVVLMLIAALVSACGSKSDSKASEPATSPESTTSITIKHDKGELKLDQPAKRVVVLEWTFTEDLIALGVQPVGNADNKGYSTWVTNEAALGKDVKDVGDRSEPNLEAIAALKPDLIVTNGDNVDGMYDQLKAIAPTIQYDPYNNEGYDYAAMERIFKNIALAVGKTKEGDQVLADLNKHYEEAKTKLAAAGKSDFHYVLTQAFTYQNAVSLRLFTNNSVVAETLARTGMINDWKPEKVEKYGFTTTTIEALPAVQSSNFIYIVQKDDDVFGASMKKNTVWNGLKFVQEKRTYPLDGSTWTFGGPISSKVLVDQVVGVITK
ncbi:iron complex transport system substrate-binding protein [Paenibacillus shirakamiensis]|uniref:Iron complex transport system substrate-binding protein n=1 Tax=Paenibacillus shirakamiensis TaxID=1265935 RepID=A0ABS4JI32_9BACL|nr:iron-siderophore ABC transporter substrate-binding protein [Paenibacillus shirakamiensis]MBP2000621.1 iron complex transport system substrate-binding protein [Paenibacillus shirakamiensis]